MNNEEWAIKEIGYLKEKNPRVATIVDKLFDAVVKIPIDEEKNSNEIMNLFIRLLEKKVLTEIENTEDIWELIGKSPNGDFIYYCKRYKPLIKKVMTDHKLIKYLDQKGQICIDINNPLSETDCSLAVAIFNEMFPISFPYVPNEDSPSKIYIEQLSYYGKNIDTIAVLYAQLSDTGTLEEIKRYFKIDADGKYEECLQSEYFYRRDRINKKSKKGYKNENC